MEAGFLSCVGLGWWATASSVQWASAALARAPRPEGTVHRQPADFSIVAPMNGAADASAAYVEALRIERARMLLEDGAESLEAVARATGFASPEVLRRAFHRRVGVSPAAYRDRFRLAA